MTYHPGTWTVYTPTWDAVSGTNPAIGNGTISGKFMQLSKTLHITIQLVAGSTTTYGTSANWQFSLPSGVTANVTTGTDAPYGVTYVNPTNATGKKNVALTCLLDTTHLTVSVAAPHEDATVPTSAGFFDNATPSAWSATAGNVILMQATFEVV